MIQNLKSLLIAFRYDDNTPPWALRYGLSLAQQADAEAAICVLVPELVLTHAFDSSVAAGLVSAENHRVRGLAEKAVRQVRQNAGTAAVPCTAEVLQEPYPKLAASLTQRAHVHDITIVDAQLDVLSLERRLLEEALFNGGHPVLIIPPGTDAFRLTKVVVAWDGSATATRAVSGALPFLKAAEHVEIVRIRGEKGSSTAAPGADLASYLARHDIPSTVTDLLAKNGDAAATLCSHVGHGGIDLLVMGAFAHSRLRELVLGGVTETMLNTCPVPLCLSH